MSIASNFPAIAPTLNLSFALTKQLDPRITFTRASTATYYGTQTAKAEENLLLQSQTFNSGSWTTVNLTLTADAATAPDGTTTAETLTDDTASQAHVCSQVVTTTAGLVYTQSFFLKASTNNFAIVTLSSATAQNYISAIVDLSTGAITETSTGTSATFTSSSITLVGSGWYRVVVTGSCTSGFTRAEMGLALAATGNTFATNGRTTYTGTGTSVFVWGCQLEQRSAATNYTPTTTQPITNYIPVLESAASGVARFDHNPTTFESLGLLIEESRTNLAIRSEDFENASWAGSFIDRLNNTIVAPNGTLTGGKIFTQSGEPLTLGTNISLFNITAAAGAYTYSVYAKKGEFNRIGLRVRDEANAGNNFSVVFDLAVGTISTAAGNTGTFTGATARSVSVGNGWYRFILTGTTTGAAALRVQIAPLDSTATTGDGFSGIFIWGAQLEVGSFATSYIPTVASQVTRAVDAAIMTGANFSSWYNQGAGTLYAEANTPSFATTYVFAEINNNSTSNYVRQSTTSAGTTTQFVVVDNTVTQANPGFAVTLGSYRKMAGAYTANSVQQSVNGSLGTEDTSATIPTGLVQINIGSRASASSAVNGTIRKIAYYPIRVTDTQLQALTS